MRRSETLQWLPATPRDRNARRICWAADDQTQIRSLVNRTFAARTIAVHIASQPSRRRGTTALERCEAQRYGRKQSSQRLASEPRRDPLDRCASDAMAISYAPAMHTKIRLGGRIGTVVCLQHRQTAETPAGPLRQRANHLCVHCLARSGGGGRPQLGGLHPVAQAKLRSGHHHEQG